MVSPASEKNHCLLARIQVHAADIVEVFTSPRDVADFLQELVAFGHVLMNTNSAPGGPVGSSIENGCHAQPRKNE